nr:DUF2254 domain-containing protein [Paracoccus saliphilus]
MSGKGLLSRGNAARALWDAVRTSLWFLPAVLGIIAPVLTFLALAIDHRLDPHDGLPGLIYLSPPSQAQDLLATVLTSMITMASLVFSITMVVLTLATSQFGPRLIRNFMGRLQTQLILGTFVMTIIYCLLLLSFIGPDEDGVTNAYFSVTVAIGLTIASVALMVLHIHKLAASIMSESLIEAVGHELDRGLRDLRPLAESDDPEKALPDDFEERAAFFGLRSSGYAQAIEFQRIIDAACAADVLIGLDLRAGDFVIPNGRAFGIYPAERASLALAETIEETITLGVHRTPVQDLEFSIRHLVEIAVRALSPGINDPYTAVSVIHRLSASWAELMRKSVPPGVFRDKAGALRIICPRPGYGSLLNASFSQIRQSGADKPIILIHLLKAMGAMSHCVGTAEQQAALRDQVRAILEDARREIPNGADLKDVEDMGRRMLNKMQDPKAQPGG